MKLLFCSLLFLASFSASANAPQAAMVEEGANIAIIFDDYASLEPFEEYTCRAHIDDWLVTYKAVKSGSRFKCLDQGLMQPDRFYLVWFTHEEWPSGFITSTPNYYLNTNNSQANTYVGFSF